MTSNFVAEGRRYCHDNDGLSIYKGYIVDVAMPNFTFSVWSCRHSHSTEADAQQCAADALFTGEHRK